MAPSPPPGSWAAFRTYLADRFPLPITAMLAVSMAAGSTAAGQAEAMQAGAPLALDGAALGGAALVLLFLFHLRVFDEHKDFAQDSAAQPDRPVQRGLVTLRQLAIAGAVALALEAALALTVGVAAGWWWVLPVGYSVIMSFEFFVKDWLERHPVIYVTTHTMVMALVVLALAARVTVRAGAGFPLEVAGAAAMGTGSFFAIDVLRKTRAPECEVPGVDSWSLRLGPARAAALGGGLLIAIAMVAAWVGWRLGGGAPWIAVCAAVTAWGLWVLRGFAAEPSARRQKRLTLVAGVHFLVVWLGLAFAAAVARGASIAP